MIYYWFQWSYRNSRNKEIVASVRGRGPGTWTRPFIEPTFWSAAKLMSKRDIKELLKNFECGECTIDTMAGVMERMNIENAPHEILESLKSHLSDYYQNAPNSRIIIGA